MPRTVTVAATQMSLTRDAVDKNIAKAEDMVRQAAAAGAQVILLQELFENHYFGQEQNPEFFTWAHTLEEDPAVNRMKALAKELGVVLPVSFFEKAANAHFNSLAMIDADGALLGVYRKSHIPDGPGYQEKFFMTPGDTGFQVYDTRYGRLGVAICWDQWFPEPARILALKGAEIIVYPSAIGTEPTDPDYNSYPHWCRTMLGHSAANMVPIIASNRVGKEEFSGSAVTYYGGSFISGNQGDIIKQMGVEHNEAGNIDPSPAPVEGFITHTFDLDQLATQRVGWGLFRDRRPELYHAITTHSPPVSSGGHHCSCCKCSCSKCRG